MPKIGKPQYTVPKAYRKRTIQIGGQTRFTLQNPKAARTAAKGITTRLERSGAGVEAEGDYIMGQALRKSLLRMAERADLPEEISAEIEAMDPAKLDWLYYNNRLLFENFFDYAGINLTPEGYVVSEDAKMNDAEFLIESYHRIFG